MFVITENIIKRPVLLSVVC